MLQKQIVISSAFLLAFLDIGSNINQACAQANVKTPMTQNLDSNGYDITAINLLDAANIEADLLDVVDIQAQGPWADPRAFGAIPDDAIDDTSAIQDALDTGLSVRLAPGAYRVSSSLQFTADGQHLEGWGGFLQTRIDWVGGDNDSIVETDSSALRHYMGVKNLYFVSTNDGIVGIDITNMSHSRFEFLNIHVHGNHTRGIYGKGSLNGDRPYHNYISQVAVASDNVGLATTGSVGIYIDRILTTEVGNHNGGNANTVIGGHLTGMDYGVIVADGIGNRFISVTSESITKSHYEFGVAASDLAGTATSAFVNSLTDSGLSEPSNAYIGGAITITGGTGAGQVRPILFHGSDTFYVSPYWTTLPDTTSTYAVVGEQGQDNSIYSPYAEGDSASGASFLKLHPGVLGTTLKGGMITAVSTTVSSGPLRTADNLTPSGWKEPIPINFVVDNVASSATSLVLKPVGSQRASIAPLGTWHVVGADVTVNGGIAGGLGEIWITSNGGKLTSQPNIRLSPGTTYNALGGSNTQVMFSTEELKSGSTYNHVGLLMDTDAAWAPNATLDVFVTLYVQMRR